VGTPPPPARQPGNSRSADGEMDPESRLGRRTADARSGRGDRRVAIGVVRCESTQIVKAIAVSLRAHLGA
jgi:hypothetical protein